MVIPITHFYSFIPISAKYYKSKSLQPIRRPKILGRMVYDIVIDIGIS